MSGKILYAGAGEKAQYLVHEFNDNTIRFVLHYPGRIEAGILSRAAAAVVNGTEILHSSFHTGAATYWTVHPADDPAAFFQCISTEGSPMAEACALALGPVAPEGTCQLCCRLVQGREDSALELSVSHLCVDGGDGKYLLGKLAEAYNRILQTGTAEGLDIKDGSRAAEQIYGNINLREYFSLMKNPISKVKSTFPFPTEEPGERRMSRLTVPAGTLTACRRKAKELGASVNDALLAAMYRAYGALPEVDGSQAMSILSMMDLRRHCKQGASEGLSNLSGSLPTTLSGGVNGDFAQTLSQVAEQTRRAKEDPLAGLEGMPLLHGATHAAPMWLLLLVAGKLYGSMSIGLTNLGVLSAGDLALGGLAPDDCVFGGPLKKKPAMQVSAVTLEGACTLSVVGSYTEQDGEALQRFLAAMGGELSDFAAL